MIRIEARNNLGVPIRLTLTSVNDGKNEDRILITIGKEGTALKSFYGVCIDTDLSLDQEWREVGSLDLETTYRVSISGNPSV